MSRIKGQYITRVVIKLDVDENEPYLKTFDQLRDTFANQITENVKDALTNSYFCSPYLTVTVEKQFADVWMAGDE